MHPTDPTTPGQVQRLLTGHLDSEDQPFAQDGQDPANLRVLVTLFDNGHATLAVTDADDLRARWLRPVDLHDEEVF